MAAVMAPRRLSIRRDSLDLSEAATYSKYLSRFQIVKFTYMFDAFFDMDRNKVIEKKDLLIMSDKMRSFAGWADDDETFKSVNDVLHMFLECLQDQVRKEKAADAEGEVIASWDDATSPAADNDSGSADGIAISLKQWLNMWGKLCYGSAGLKDFPIWVQFLPEIFFSVIDNDKDGVLSKEEYARFYRDFVGVEGEQLALSTDEGYRAMTANGDYVLDRDNFNFCFSNFLLGRTIYGPGKHIFGVFDNSDSTGRYQITYCQETEEEE